MTTPTAHTLTTPGMNGRATHKPEKPTTLDLADPIIARYYMTAMRIVHELPHFRWYDSYFLARFEAAQRMVEIISPARLDEFIAAFDPVRTRADFETKHISKPLSEDDFSDILAQVHALPPSSLNPSEQSGFGREILRDLPALRALQETLTPLVTELAGQAVEPSYTFLSLYNGDGKCPPHLDAPSAKWTLDICLEQSSEWPIYFSKVTPWPTTKTLHNRPSSSDYSPHILRPNEAILFSGSSQWHHRRAIPDGGFCHLAFLHYYPAGCANLVKPERWPAHFNLPELGVLNFVMDALRPDHTQ